MSPFYTNQHIEQAESEIFGNANVTPTAKDLDYKQSRIKLNNENFLKIQSEVLNRARPVCSWAECSILEYIMRNSDNATGKVYRSQETIGAAFGIKERQARRHLDSLKSKGFIDWKKPEFGSACVYWYRYDMLNAEPAMVHKCGTRADSPPAKPDITTIRSSDDRLSTLKSKEEISINTNPIKYDFFVEQNEPRVPIPVAEFSARQSTRECVKRKLGHYSYDFVDECEKGFRLEPLEQGILRMPDEWNRKFNVYCHKSQWLKDNRPNDKDKKWIPRHVRLTHNAAVNSQPHTEVHADAHEPYVSKEPDAPPISKAIIYGPIQQPDYKGALTPEDHEEMDESANEYYRKNNVRPPKYD